MDRTRATQVSPSTAPQAARPAARPAIRPGGSAASGAETRERLLVAATRAFAEHGAFAENGTGAGSAAPRDHHEQEHFDR